MLGFGTGPLYFALQQQTTTAELENFFNSDRFGDEVRRQHIGVSSGPDDPIVDQYQWAARELAYMQRTGRTREQADRNFKLLLEINSLQNYLLKDTHFFAYSVGKAADKDNTANNDDWFKIDDILEKLQNKPEFVDFSKRLNFLETMIHFWEPKNASAISKVCGKFIKFPELINHLDDNNKRDLFLKYFQYGNVPEISALLATAGKEELKESMARIFSSPDNQIALMKALDENQMHFMSKPQLIDKWIKVSNSFDNEPTFKYLFTGKTRSTHEFLQSKFVTGVQDKESQVQYLKYFLQYKKSEQIENHLTKSQLSASIFSDKSIFPSFIEALSKNEHVWTKDLYIKILEKIDYNACYPGRNQKDSIQDESVYKETLEKLKKLSEQPFPVSLKGLLSEKEFKNILNYLSENLQMIPVNEIQKLDKKTTSLKRSINIQRLDTGEVKIFIELKRNKEDDSKDKDDLANENNVVQGGHKVGKLAFEVLSGKMMYNLVATTPWAVDLFSAIKENKIAHDLNMPEVDTPLLGKLSIKQDETGGSVARVNIYSERALSDLQDFLKKQTDLPLQTRWQLAVDCLKIVDTVHKKGIFHHDIKGANFLVYEQNGKFSLKLTDFGCASPNYDWSKRTAFFISPEAAWKDLERKSRANESVYDKEDFQVSFGYVFLVDRVKREIEDNKESGDSEQNEDEFPPEEEGILEETILEYSNIGDSATGKASDNWSSGILLSAILYGFSFGDESNLEDGQQHALLADWLFHADSSVREELDAPIRIAENALAAVQNIEAEREQASQKLDEAKNTDSFFNVLYKFQDILANKDGTLVLLNRLKRAFDYELRVDSRLGLDELEKYLENKEEMVKFLTEGDYGYKKLIKSCDDFLLEHIAKRMQLELKSVCINKKISSLEDFEELIAFVKSGVQIKDKKGDVLDSGKLVEELEKCKDKATQLKTLDEMKSFTKQQPLLSQVTALSEKIVNLAQDSMREAPSRKRPFLLSAMGHDDRKPSETAKPSEPAEEPHPKRQSPKL